MLYHLLFPLREYVSGLNIFRYISFRSAGAAILALFISFLIGPAIIRYLKRKQLGELIRQDGPQTHLSKAGTPSMGGLIVLASIIIPTLLMARLDNLHVWLVLFATAFMGAVGFLDDYLKIIKKVKKGLIGRYKLAGQISLGLIVGSVLYFFPDVPEARASTTIPFLKNYMINFGIFYIPFVAFIITATSNGENLTDGLDGLAIGLTAIAALAFGAIAYVSGRVDHSSYLNIIYLRQAGEVTIYCAALFGASLGFLWFNAHPAQVFLGDTGALALGGALGTIAVLVKKEILLVLICGIFLMESLSVIIQVFYFKRTGRRIFKMAPIHHHFELMGWKEPKVVIRFWIIGILLAMLTLATFKIR